MNVLAAISVSTALLAGGLGARRLAALAERPLALGMFARAVLAPALLVGVFLTAVGLVGRWFESFDAGLAAGALGGVLLAVLSVIWSRRVQPSELAPQKNSGLALRVALVTLLAGALYAYLAARYQMHDENAIYGHKSIIEELRHGYYPPYAPPLPDVEARYHYGYDVLAGALARAYGFSTDTSIDVVCVLMVLFMSLGAAAVAADNGAEESAPFAAVAVHFGAGLAAFMLGGVAGRHPRCAAQYHHPSCGVELFPTQILNVFQHPVSLGVPLFLVLVLLAPRLVGQAKDRTAPWITAAMLAVILPALSIGQFVYYGLGVLGLLAALPILLFDLRRDGARALLLAAGRVLVLLALVHGVAYALGGMLARADVFEPGLFARRTVLGFPEKTSFLEILRHHLVNLGLGFLLLPAFAAILLFRRRAAHVHLFAFACGGILVPHLYSYSRSWDIVKFPSAASFALVLLYVLLIDRALAKLEFPWAWLRRGGRLLICGTGLTAAVFITFPLCEDIRLYDLGNYSADPQVQKCIDWLWGQGYAKEEMVYSQSNVAQQFAIFGGLSVIAEDTDLYYQGFKNSILNDQRRWSAEIKSSLTKRALDALHVRWVILSDEEVRNLGERAQHALDEGGPLELAASFDDPEKAERRRRIWRVK